MDYMTIVSYSVVQPLNRTQVTLTHLFLFHHALTGETFTAGSTKSYISPVSISTLWRVLILLMIEDVIL